MSGRMTTREISAAMRLTIVRGVAPCTCTPNQMVPSNPGKPASAKVGTSAIAGVRLSPVIAMPRILPDLMCDNAAAGAMITGGRLVRPFDLDIRWVGATLSKNGVIEESGVSAAVMGHPAAGIAWLVNKLSRHGVGLKAGQMVLAGSFTRPINIVAGDVIQADYGPLGTLGVRFV